MMNPGVELLTADESARADALAVAAGRSFDALMEAAGAAVAAVALRHFDASPVLVLCGPGNNGGDGYVAARHLAAAGRAVRVAALAPPRPGGAAAAMATRWGGPVEAFSPGLFDGIGLVVDAVFGTGLGRPIDGFAAETFTALAAAGVPVLSVDLPSGIDGDTGAVLGTAVRASRTVTFFRRKPGHLLLPGRAHAGIVEVADIGIPDSVLTEIAPRHAENAPALWRQRFPRPDPWGHKYQRGHAVIAGGGRMTGAPRLAARAAQRVGAGMVSVACPPDAFPIYAATLDCAVIEPIADPGGFARLLARRRGAAVLLGPGNGVSPALRRRVLETLDAARPTVLDAGALTAFADDPAPLLARLHGGCILTPHEGEFARVFDPSGPRVARARRAAARAVMVLKGADTVIAAPDGRVAINANAPPDLATAGAGDVLAGLAVGLAAQGAAAFEAACMAVWLHGAAATEAGPGLIAADLPEALPTILRTLRDSPPV